MVNFRNLAVTTAVFTGVLMVLGALVVSVGGGVSCPTWPSCRTDVSGFASWIPVLSNFPMVAEWVHRLVAMITGFLILGTTIEAWRNQRENRAIVWWSTAALVLLPLQVVIGGWTVLSDIAWVSLVLHQLTAVLIFGSLVVVAMLAWFHDPPAFASRWSSPSEDAPRS